MNPTQAATAPATAGAVAAQVGSGSAAASTTTTATAVGASGAPKKSLIRKIVAIDLNKLRQTGLDRKIAEAMSKQKLATTGRLLSTVPMTTKTTMTAATTTTTTLTPSTTAMSAVSRVPPTTPATVIKKMVPPKITITRPMESPPMPTPSTPTNLQPTEEQLKFNPQLSSSSERLAHAKNMLKQNLMMKARARNAEALRHATPPPQSNAESTGFNLMATSENSSSSLSTTGSNANNNEPSFKTSRATFVDRPKKVMVFKTLKPPPTVVRKPSPIKTPQEIARILDFSSGSSDATINNMPKEPPLVLNYSLPVPHNQIPYASATLAHNYSLHVPQKQIPYTSDGSAAAASTLQVSHNQIPYTAAASASVSASATSTLTNRNKLPYSFASPSPTTSSFQDTFKKQITAGAEKHAQMRAAELINYIKSMPINYQHLPETKVITQTSQDTNSEHAETQDDDIPKASIKASTIRSKTITQPSQDTSAEHAEKNDDDIPKASIKASAMRSKIIKKSLKKSAAAAVADTTASHTVGMNAPSLHCSAISSVACADIQRELPIDFPEVSPLKQPFPSISLPGESPLPTISTFKKPFSTAMQPPVTVKLESNEYFAQQNYFPMSSYHMQTTAAEPFTFIKPNPAYTASTTKSLIVLEHKVLSHDEKIDLTALRLPNPAPPLSATSSTSSMFNTPVPPGSVTGEIAIKQEHNLEELLPKPSPEQFKAPQIATKPLTSFRQPRKFIQAADKLKLPPEKIAALAKQIQTQTLAKLKKQSGTILRIPTKANVMEQLARVRKVELDRNQLELVQPVKVEKQDAAISTTYLTTAPPPISVSSGHQFKLIKAMKTEPTLSSADLNYEFISENKPNIPKQNTSSELHTTTEPTELAKIVTKQEINELSSPDCDYYQTHQFTYPYNSTKSSASVEIMKEPWNSNGSLISAVDFIASLTSSHPITEETTLELSPEELNLNASFAMNLSPIRIPYYSRKESQLPKKRHIAEMSTPDDHHMNEETVAKEATKEFIATEDMFLSDDGDGDDFGVEIGNIVTIENDNNVSQLSPNAEGIIKIPSIDGVKKERDIIIAPIANESLRKKEEIKLVNKNSESRNELNSKDINLDIHNEKTMNKAENTENTATVVIANKKVIFSSTEELSGEFVNQQQKSDVAVDVLKHIETSQESRDVEVSVVPVNEIQTFNTSSQMKNQQLNRNEINAPIPRNEQSKTNETINVLTEEIITANTTKANESQKLPEIDKHLLLDSKETNESKETISEAISLQTSEDVSLEEHTHISNTTTAASSTAAAAKKRTSRFKKGKINLVQRKKSTVSNTQSKIEISNEKAKIQQNEEEKSTIAAIDNTNEEGNIHPIGLSTKNSLEVKKSVKVVPLQEEVRNESTSELVELLFPTRTAAIKHTPADFTIKKDISQLVNPPPMPKKKRPVQEDITAIQKTTEEEAESTNSNSVSLLEVINMTEEPESLLPAQIPFKPKSIEHETKLIEEQPVGIQSLLTQLEAGKITNSNNKHESQFSLEDNKIVGELNIEQRKSLQLDITKLSEKLTKQTVDEQTSIDSSVGKEVAKNNAKNKSDREEQVSSEIPFQSNKGRISTLKVTEVVEHQQMENIYIREVQPEHRTQYSKSSEISDSLMPRDNSTPIQKHSTSSSLEQAMEGEELEATNDVTLTPPNVQSLKSINVLKTPPKGAPSVQTHPDMCGEIKKFKYPSQSSEDAEIDSTQSYHDFDDDEEIAATAEESSQELVTMKTIQRKRLRKSVQGNVKNRKRPFDTDSEDDREGGSAAIEVDVACHSIASGAVNEFLGFDETSPTNSKMQKNLDFIIAATSAEDDSADETETTRGRRKDSKAETPTSSNIVAAVADGDTTTMKNWLTTGKAIAPTSFYKSRKVRQKVSMVGKSERSGCGRSSTNMPLKKRWEKRRQYEETDITDDTSPADDDDEGDKVDAVVDNDEEENFEKLLRANLVIAGKRSLQMLNAEEKVQVIASKKLKLPEELKEMKTNSRSNKGESDTDNKEASFLRPLPPTPPDEDAAIGMTIAITAAATTVTKKRAGRRPKAKEIVEPLEMNISSETRTRSYRTPTRFSDEVGGAGIDSPTTTPNNDSRLISMKVIKVTEEINEAETPASTSTPNIPKKRGRKPKIECTEGTTELTMPTAADTISSESTSAGPKKRKTRNSIDPEDNASTISETTINNGTTELNSIIESLETTTQEKTPSLTDAKESEDAPKKRGRKPKAKAITTLNVEEKNNATVSETTVTEHKSIIEYFETTITTPVTHTVEVNELAVASTDIKQPVNKPMPTATETTPNTPKKRGRKPNTVCHEVATTSTTLTTSTVESPQPVEELLMELQRPLEEPETTASVPKKRGRKPKSVTTEMDVMIQVKSESVLNENTPLAPKKRGRKPKIQVEEDDTATTTSAASKPKSIIEYFEAHDGAKVTTRTSDAKSSESTPMKPPSNEANSTNSPMPKKRGRKPKPLTIPPTTSGESECDASFAADDYFQPPNFNARLLLIRKRTELDSEEVLTASAATAGTGPLRCGLCLMRLTRPKWAQHLAEHYGVGWIDGEPELNIHQRSAVLNIMTNFYKVAQSKELACRMCTRTYRSGLGMLTHIETCGVPRIRCENCNRMYYSISMAAHQRTCSQRLVVEEDAMTAVTADSTEVAAAVAVVPNVLNNVGRVKRVSLLKAESKLKAIGEELVSADAAESKQFVPKNHIKYHAPLAIDVIRNEWKNGLENMGKAVCPQKACRFYLEATTMKATDLLTALEEHLDTCKHIPKPGYHCLRCRNKLFKLEADAIKHVLQVHKPQAGSDFEADSSDCDVNTGDDSGGDNDDESSGEDEDGGAGSLGVNSFDEPLTDAGTTSSTPGSKRRRRPAASSPKKSQRRKKAKIQRPPMFQSVYKPVYPRRSDNCTLMVARKWKEFCALNHANELLYTYAIPTYSTSAVNLVADLQIVNNDVSALEKCLPNQRVSMKYAFAAKSRFQKELGTPDATVEWSELKRFETAQMHADQFVFLGAPVNTLAWAPLPSNVHEQYLAVAYRKDIDKYTRMLNPKIAPALILIYKVTTTTEGAEHVQTPQLLYGIHIPDGPVQSFAFLPSGGYDDDTNRLGLLAVGTAVGATINIYALPLRVQAPQEQEKLGDQTLNVIELKPSLALTLDMELMHSNAAHTMIATQCLQICWSETPSHSHIFASYSNGCIGIWDTATDDANTNLNCFMVKDLRHFVPLNYFYVGEKVIRALAIHYDSGGPRWLAAACHSRKFIVYDIRDMTQPLPLKEEHSKNIIRSMDWSALWETPLIGFCDIVPRDGRAATAISLNGVIFNRNKIDNMLCGVSQIHYNPALNVHVCATDNGDVIFLNTRELHREDVFPKSQKNSRAVAMMDIKCLDGGPLPQCNNNSGTSAKSNEVDMEENDDQEAVEKRIAAEAQDFKQRFGVVFGDVINYKLENKTNYLSTQRTPPHSVVPYMRVNSLRCNLNVPSRRLVAVGFENGFLRIMRFNPKNIFKETQ